ncbi:MAG TPA: response regulator transcription factor [Chitinophagaceae bacterium]|jgi:DNA-binding NarL/FixJ family response regulator|nr:response regulator transcription factor [Chitinophagaceae bacterium]
MKQKVVLVDDHSLLRNGLAGVVKDLGYDVLFEADNGKDLQKKLDKENLPDFVLLDINMKEMDGYETAQWLKATYPLIKILALSMYDDENAIIKMLKNGARGYILKDSEPGELRTALDAIITKGYYYSELVTGKLIHSINRSDDEAAAGNIAKLNDREVEFLKLACSELTYKEIAAQMHLSPRTIDGYRDALFEKLNIKTRTGLAIYAIKNGVVTI